jgi:outer membrane protein
MMLRNKMKILKKGLKPVGFLVLIVISSIVFGQEPLSLKQALKIGLEKNYQIQISEKSLEIAQNNNSWGLAGAYPFITLGASQVNRFDDQPSTLVPGQRNEYFTNAISPNVRLSWTLFDGFSVKISKQKLELLEDFTSGNAAVVVENTIQSIILAYYRVLLEEEKLKVLADVKSLSGDRYDYEMMKKDLGSSVTYNVLQARNAFLNDSSSYLLQQLNLKNARMNLHLLMADEPNVFYTLTDAFTFDPPEYDFSSMLGKMLADNKSLKNQFINQEILGKEIAYQKSALYPNLAINAGADHANSSLKFKNQDASYSNSYDYYANLSLSFNLSNGGNVKRAIQNAKVEEQIGELTIAEMQRSLSNRLINFYDLYKIRKQLLAVSMANEESAKLNLEISTGKFKSGAINSFNYRDVQLIFLNISIQRLEAIYNLIDTHTELLRITGGVISQ